MIRHARPQQKKGPREWHSRGRQFDPGRLHSLKSLIRINKINLFRQVTGRVSDPVISRDFSPFPGFLVKKADNKEGALTGPIKENII